jgi:hypothetical protein
LAATIGLRAASAGEAAAPKATVVIVRDANVLNDKHEMNVEVFSKMLDQAIAAATGQADAAAAWKTIAQPGQKVGLVPTAHVNATHKELIDAVRARLVAAGIPEGDISDVQGRKMAHAACQVLVPLPNLKCHWLTGIGTVLKDYIQFSGKPTNYHQDNSNKLGEIWLRDDVKGKTRIVIVDALRPLCDKGPQVDPKYLWHYNGVIVGTDPVAVEAVCLKILQTKRDAIKGEAWPISPPPICVEAADKQYKLGCSDLAQIAIKKLGWEQEALV